MIVKIEAPKHPRQAALKEFYESEIHKKFSKHQLLKEILVKVVEKDGLDHVSLNCISAGGAKLFATAKDRNEHKAFQMALKKIESQLQKLKGRMRSY